LDLGIPALRLLEFVFQLVVLGVSRRWAIENLAIELRQFLLRFIIKLQLFL
jgi:hypothetical protein